MGLFSCKAAVLSDYDRVFEFMRMYLWIYERKISFYTFCIFFLFYDTWLTCLQYSPYTLVSCGKFTSSSELCANSPDIILNYIYVLLVWRAEAWSHSYWGPIGHCLQEMWCPFMLVLKALKTDPLVPFHLVDRTSSPAQQLTIIVRCRTVQKHKLWHC